MSYAPGSDGPPVSELPELPDSPDDDGVICCPDPGLWIMDRYYAARWPDDPSPDVYVWTHSCGKSWKGPEL